MKKMFHSNIGLVLFVVLITVSLACGGTTSTPKSTISTATSAPGVVQPTSNSVEAVKTQVSPTQVPPTQVPATATTAPEYFLGDAVQDGDYALTALTVADPATPGMLYSAEEGKKLVAVEIIVSNVSGNVLNVNPLYATLLDDSGFVYQTDLGSVDGSLSSLNLSPGEQARGWVSYKLPDNATAASIKVSTDILGSNSLKAPLTAPPSGHTPVTITVTPSLPASKLGDVVEQSGYSLSASQVEDPTTPNMFYTNRPGYKLVSVEIVLSNVSSEQALSSNPYYAYLVDSNGFVYSAELMGRDGQIDALDMNSGEKVQGWVSFTVPDNATLAYIKYETGIFSGQYLIAGLTE